MLGRTHAITGATAALAVAVLSGEVSHVPTAAYALAAAAALLPDLDSPSSLALRLEVTRPVHAFLRHLRHRQATHSLVGIAVFAIIAGLILEVIGRVVGQPLSPALWTMAVVGYASHIVADLFNKQGCGLLWPFVPRRSPLEWITIPVPRPFRISTITDPKGPPITLGRIQARIPTEKVFFRWPVQLAALWLVWHSAEAIVAATRGDVWFVVSLLPEPARVAAETLLR